MRWPAHQASVVGTAVRGLDRAVERWGARVAIHDGERSLTYDEVGRMSDNVASRLLDLGIERGDRVGMLMPNCLEFLPTLWGLWKAGAAFTQLPARAGVSDLLHSVDHVGVRAILTHRELADSANQVRAAADSVEHVAWIGGADSGDHELERWFAEPGTATRPEVACDWLGATLFTSGTTGQPKAVVLDHSAWSHYGYTAGAEVVQPVRDEVFAHVAPLTHVSLMFTLPVFAAGGTNVVLPGFDVEKLADVAGRLGVTATAMVPTMIYKLLERPDPRAGLETLRTLVYAGSPMAPERLAEALELFGPVFVQTYAGSEPGFVSCLTKEDHVEALQSRRERLGSAGRPLLHVDVQIQDDEDRPLPVGEIGEICVASPGQMRRYWDADRTGEAMRGRWVHSGDVGFLDDGGYLTLVDRKKDMVISGGFNVFPAQVEEVLTRHPAVIQAAVIGIPDPTWGEAVTAFCILRPGTQVSPDELVALVREHKGSVHAPKSVEFVESLPTTPAGKVDKKVLRAPYWEGLDRAVG
jgi:acyl-CoA synthetase (AMP-forming)/AMP-acid ligase II